jgi:hypothetical protein
MSLDWIKQRATAARHDERNERWQMQKARVIESHSHEFFEALTNLMEQSVAAFNKEFEGEERSGVAIEKRLNRFIVRHAAPPATAVDCRLDYAAHGVRCRIERASRDGKQTFCEENTLKFDMASARKIQLLTVDGIPMSLEQTTQLLLEPFF